MHVGKKPDLIKKNSTDEKNSEEFTDETYILELNTNVAQQENKLRKLNGRSRVEKLKLQEESKKGRTRSKIAATELRHVDAEAKVCKTSLKN